MRLFINHDKPKLVFLLTDYLNQLVLNHEVKMVVNGETGAGTITHITLEDTESNAILISLQSEEGSEHTYKIPLLNETKVRLQKELVRFETKSHATIIDFSS